MTDADDMVNITQGELQELVGEDAGRICEAEQRMISEHSPQSHCPRV